MADEPNLAVHRDKPRGRRRRLFGRSYGIRARTVAAGAIIAVWAASTLADIATRAYQPPEGLNTVALAAATYLFGSAFISERKTDDDDA